MGWDTRDDSSFLTHFKGRVKKSFWDTNARLKGDGKTTLLFWEVEVLDIYQESFDKVPPPETLNTYGIGKKWNADEAGVTVENEDPNVEEFGKSSALGKIIDAVIGKKEYDGALVLDGGDEDLNVSMTGVKEYMLENGFSDPRDATVWVDLVFDFRGIDWEYKGLDRDPRAKPFPVYFHGHAEDLGLDSSGSSSAQTASEAPQAPQEATGTDTTPLWVEAGASDDLAATLAQLVSTSSSHTQFSRNALILDDVKSNEALKAAVMDEVNGPWSKR